MTATRGSLVPTLTLAQAAERAWDVLVVGAGPAGAMAARETARRGASVLLVDKTAFPRRKVCGCCLNAAALVTLKVVGLGELPSQLGGRPLRELRLAAGGWQASIPLPGGVALSRERFDAALVQDAISAGAHFLPQTLATLEEIGEATRCLRLQCGEDDVLVDARVVLAADGLGGRLLQHEPGCNPVVACNSRVGIGTMVDPSPDWYHAGTIVMACGRGGYAGLVQVEDGRLDVAAALDPSFVRRVGGAGAAVTALLAHAGLPALHGLSSLAWQGAPALTRRRLGVAGDRLFVLGDAAGYVEPFTGEGIAWALASAAAVAPLALEAVRRWTPTLAVQWTHRYRRLVGRRQHTCRLVTRLLRRAALTRAAVGVLSQVPALVAPLVRYLNSPFPLIRDGFEWDYATSA